MGTLIASSAALAQNEVLSKNAVGYVKLQVQPGAKFTLIGDTFRNFDPGTPRTFSNIFTLGNGLVAAAVPANADSIIVWDSVGQKYTTYGMKTDGKVYNKANWGGVASNLVVSPDQSLFIQTRASSVNPTNMFIMGEVPGQTGVTMQVTGSLGSRPFSFLSNPYPVEVALNELINTKDGAIATTVPSTCDTINLWDEDTQSYIGLGLRLNGGGTGTNEWRLKSSFGVSPVTPYKVGPGKGFIYQRASTAGAFSFSVKRPYSWPKDEL